MRIDCELFPGLGLRPTIAVYPGHPIVLAFCIIKAFKDFQTASEKGTDNTPHAVASTRIPGAGGCVYAALDLLASLHKGVSLKAAFEDADAFWDRTDDHKVRQKACWAQGQAQADAIKPLFSGNESWWQGAEPATELKVL